MSHGTSSAVQPFNFNDKPVRIVMIDDEPWFVAADVCAALTIGDVGKAAGRLDQADRTQALVTASDGRRVQTWVINESGLYELVIRSDKPQAREFRRWITSEVLPQIRRTGAYLTPGVDPLEMLRQQVVTNLATVEQMIELRDGQAQLAARVEALEGNYGRITALAYAKLNGLRDGVNYLAALGRVASAVARRDGVPVEKAHSTIFGTVNAWPVEVWDEALSQVGS